MPDEDELNDEVERGELAAQAMVSHMAHMGFPAAITFPNVDLGDGQLYELSVQLKKNN